MGDGYFYWSTPFEVVRTYDEFCSFIEKKFKEGEWPKVISFDHDLADEHYHPYMTDAEAYSEVSKTFKEKTGMDCAKWLVDFCMDNNLKLPGFVVHSMNPSGSKNIQSLLSNFRKHQDEQWDLYCNECGWIGNEDELKTAMLENENNTQDKTLYETKVCPECRKNNYSK
jgi:hypothetical protein